MLDFTADNLTETVVAACQKNASSPRTKQIMGSLVTHLHAFAKEVELTESEWFKAIEFLTETGKLCDDKRQEFILLSDTLGLSMLVDAINHPRTGLGTENTVLGPFHVPGAPRLPMGSSIVKQDLGGERTLVRGKVTDAQGAPIDGATLDVWQTSANRLYDVQDPDAPDWNLRGRFTTAADGRYWFTSEKPTSYPIPIDGPVGVMLKACGRHNIRPGHLHFIVTADGFDQLTTHIFTEGDEYLESDVVFATKSSLVGQYRSCDDSELAADMGLEVPFLLVEYDFGLMPAGN